MGGRARVRGRALIRSRSVSPHPARFAGANPADLSRRERGCRRGPWRLFRRERGWRREEGPYRVSPATRLRPSGFAGPSASCRPYDHVRRGRTMPCACPVGVPPLCFRAILTAETAVILMGETPMLLHQRAANPGLSYAGSRRDPVGTFRPGNQLGRAGNLLPAQSDTPRLPAGNPSSPFGLRRAFGKLPALRSGANPADLSQRERGWRGLLAALSEGEGLAGGSWRGPWAFPVGGALGPSASAGPSGRARGDESARPWPGPA
jgi:hypothetical protein